MSAEPVSDRHPELDAEQAHLDWAYACLEDARERAHRITGGHEAQKGGTNQHRFERESMIEGAVNRLSQLNLGDRSLVFGRIDPTGTDEKFYIGRLGVWDRTQDPVVVDWRAPIAEPFYRATGRQPMGIDRRRHFATRGRTLLGIDDELFGDLRDVTAEEVGTPGQGALIAALEASRTGRLGDIVATIQGEQDEIIRADMPGVLVVQGGPGTGKTVVALHRAAYLLYTHRFPLEDQGVLVIGPNRVFLKYIEQVLPSLGEAGIEQVVLGDLVPDVSFAGRGDAGDSPLAARVKGDARMSDVIDHAINDRERPLRNDLVVPFRSGYVRLRADESARIVKNGRRRFRRHNSARKWVEGEVWAAMASSWRGDEVTPREVRSEVRSLMEVREALERMWPVLTPAELLHDLFGSMALLRLAADGVLHDREFKALYRQRSESVDDVRWTAADVALLDDAREVLGPKPGKNGKIDEFDEIRTYGHIVIDEVQDLTPMQLKMASRRSLSGSMTVVGDIAQATGPLAPDRWEDVLEFLPDRKPSRVIGLSVGYRIPSQIMELANKVMAVATPGLRAPESVRVGDVGPRVVRVDELIGGVLDEVRRLRSELTNGSVAVVAPDDLADEVSDAMTAAGLEHGRASNTGLDQSLTVVPVSVVKGLELDAVVVVEPGRVVTDQEHGMRALYVALTRSTQRLSIVHADDLPEPLR